MRKVELKWNMGFAGHDLRKGLMMMFGALVEWNLQD